MQKTLKFPGYIYIYKGKNNRGYIYIYTHIRTYVNSFGFTHGVAACSTKTIHKRVRKRGQVTTHQRNN